MITLDELKVWAKKHKNEIIVGSVGIFAVILVRGRYKATHVPLALANSIIADAFAEKNGNFQGDDGFYDVLQIERLR